jgi:hypothetical protein
MKTWQSTWGTVLVACLAVVGCASMRSERGVEALELSLTTYGNALRWGYYDEAARYRVTRGQLVKPINQDELKDIRVISYEILDRLLSSDQTEATITVSISYFREDTGKVKTFTDRQIWWYGQALSRWFLDGDLPNFTRYEFENTPW